MEKDLVDLVAALTAVQEKCLKQNVQNVEQTAKCHSSHEKTGQYIADSVIQNTKNSD